jgi:hypothetical protein
MKYLKLFEDFDLFKYGNYTDPDEIEKIKLGDKLLCIYSNYDAFNFGKFYSVKEMSKRKTTFNVYDNNDHKRFFYYDDDHVLYRRLNYDENKPLQLTILTTDKSIEDFIERMEMDKVAKKYNI